MRKVLLLAATLLSCFHTYSQEDKTSNVPEFVLSSRFDVVPSIATASGGYDKFNFTGSAIYSFLDGNIGDHVSYSMSNHWVGTETKALYKDLGYNTSNWIDWLYFSFHNDKFDFSIGKNIINIGLWEQDPNDIDVHSTMASTMWWGGAFYQWGAKFQYTLSEKTNFSFNFSTSPFSEKHFSSKLFHYGVRWEGQFGWWSPKLSGHLMGYEPSKYVKMICLGQQFTVGETTLELDYSTYSNGWRTLFSNEGLLRANAISPLGKKENFELLFTGGYEFCREYDILGDGEEYSFEYDVVVPTGLMPKKNYYYVGGGVNYYPLNESKDLRLHMTAAYNNYAKSIALAIGVTYHFNLTKLLTK